MTTMLRTSRMGTAALLVLALPFEVTTADDLPLTVDAAVWQNALTFPGSVLAMPKAIRIIENSNRSWMNIRLIT